MFDFKCGILKIYAVLELNCRYLYINNFIWNFVKVIYTNILRLCSFRLL
jgi:hypothetical protein